MKKPYAVIQLNGKQFLVSEGDVLEIDSAVAEQKLFITDVLLVVSDKGIQVGQPLVAKAKVTLNLVEEKRTKTRVAKFRSKSRYRKIYGHKQPQSVLKVESISA